MQLNPTTVSNGWNHQIMVEEGQTGSKCVRWRCRRERKPTIFCNRITLKPLYPSLGHTSWVVLRLLLYCILKAYSIWMKGVVSVQRYSMMLIIWTALRSRKQWPLSCRARWRTPCKWIPPVLTVRQSAYPKFSTFNGVCLVLERFFSRSERQKLFRSWAGSASMWIKACHHHISFVGGYNPRGIVFSQGGDAVWGNATHSPEDHTQSFHSHGELIAFRRGVNADNLPNVANMTADEAGSWILEHTPSTFQVSPFACLFQPNINRAPR
jgi:hypothetical protein